MDYEIFISYRRKGGKGYARALALELEVRGYRVFFDFDALKDGKFDKRIMEAIDSAPIFISVLSPHCFDRCVNADDWVRQEIEYAFKHEKHIVPVNPDRLFRDLPDGTPEIICQALGHQFSDVMMTSLFKVSMDKMVSERIEPVLGGRNGRSHNRNNVQDTIGQGSFTSVLKVETDLDCRIYVDGVERGMALTGNVSRIPFRGGTYRLRFVAIDFPDVFSEEKRYHIDSNTEEFYSVELMPLKKAAEEKREAERKAEAKKKCRNICRFFM